MNVKNLEVLVVLTTARALIADPKHWNKGDFATTAEGLPVNYTDDEAKCFCTVGAINRAGVDTGAHMVVRGAAKDALRLTMAKGAGAFSLVAFNDNPLRTHAEVLALFDGTITQLAQEP